MKEFENLVSFNFIEDYDVEKLAFAFKNAIYNLDFEHKLKKDSKVLLKICMPEKKDKNTAVCTHPAVVEAIAKVLAEYDVKLILADSPYGKFSVNHLNNVYYTTGMLEVANNTNIELNTNLKTFDLAIPEGIKTKSVTVLDVLYEADIIINIGKVKFDKRLGYLGVAANMLGAIPGELKKDYLNRLTTQRDFNNFIIDINSVLHNKTILNVLDGIVAMEQTGDPRMLSAFIVGENCYSVDAFLLNLLNVNYNKTIIKVANERDIIDIDNPYKLIGDSVSNINPDSFLPFDFSLDSKINFNKFTTKSYFKRHQEVPIINPTTCKGCSVCTKICPADAIIMKYDKAGELYANIDYKKCIHCKKCVTSCPYKVIKVKTPVAHKKMKKTLNKFNKQSNLSQE